MKRVNDLNRSWSDRAAAFFTPGTIAGLALIGFGVLVLLNPQILIALIAFVFIAAGLAVLAWSRDRRRVERMYYDPARVHVRRIFYDFWGDR